MRIGDSVLVLGYPKCSVLGGTPTFIKGSFFSNGTATTEIYTLSLHDALPISISGKTVKLMVLIKLLPILGTISGKTVKQIGRAVQQECRDRYRMPSSA